MDERFTHTNIQVWIHNSKGEYLIFRRKTESRFLWEPLCCNLQDHENAMEAILRECRKTVGLQLTPTMGNMLWTEEGGDNGITQVWRFDYQNEELDSFTFGKDDIQSAVWVNAGMIRELYQANLFYPEVILPNYQIIIGEIKPFSAMHRHEMLLTINCLQKMIVPLLKNDLHPDSEIMAERLFDLVNIWIRTWNLEGTKEADYQLILAHSRLAHTNMLLRQFDRAIGHFTEELKILECQNQKQEDSTLLFWMANAHGWLAIIEHELGASEKEKQETEIRASLLKKHDEVIRKEIYEWRPGMRSWGNDLCDDSIFDDQYILSMDDETSIITLCHYMADYHGTEELIISDYTWNLPICQLTDSLYSDLSKLRTVKINTTALKNMVGNPFAGCINLAKIDIIPENHSFKMIGNCLMTGDGRRLICHLPAVSDSICIVPEGTVCIGKNTFHSCKNLIRVYIPESVKTIEDGAFYECTCLEEVNLPDGLTEISNWAFANCHVLKDVKIPKSVKRIGEFAFTECKCINNIILPEYLDELDSFAFSYCESLTAISMPETVKDKGYMVFNGSPVEADLPEYQDDEDPEDDA